MPNWKKVIVSGSNATLNSLNVTTNVVAQSFTGSLQGTSSWAVNALSSSYSLNSTSASYALNATTASHAVSALSASYALNATSASYALNATSASYALNSTTASYAATSSNILGGTQYYVPFFNTNTTVSSSYLYQSGSILKTIFDSDQGLYLKNNYYALGINAIAPPGISYVGFTYDANLGISKIGDPDHVWIFGGVGLIIDEDGNFIKSRSGGSDIGLNLDFANSQYKLGDFTDGNITINNTRVDISKSTYITGSLYLSSSLHSAQGASAGIGTTTIASITTGSYKAGFFDYVASSGGNARAGTVMSVWDGGSVSYVDSSTTDIGSTTAVTMSVALSGGNALLRATVNADTWAIKTTYRVI